MYTRAPSASLLLVLASLAGCAADAGSVSASEISLRAGDVAGLVTDDPEQRLDFDELGLDPALLDDGYELGATTDERVALDSAAAQSALLFCPAAEITTLRWENETRERCVPWVLENVRTDRVASVTARPVAGARSRLPRYCFGTVVTYTTEVVCHETGNVCGCGVPMFECAYRDHQGVWQPTPMPSHAADDVDEAPCDIDPGDHGDDDDGGFPV